MPPTDPWKRYLDTGLELTQLTRQRAEKVVRDLMKAGEVQREEVQERVEELLDRSRRRTEAIVDLVRDEVSQQLAALGLTPKRARPAASTAKKTTANTAKKAASTAKKSTAKKSTIKATGAAKKTASKAAGATKKATGAS